MIRLEGVSKIFNPGQINEVKALKEIDLHFEAGSFTVVLGSNGSGKSTLLNIIAGSEFPSTGKVSIEGKDITRWPDYKRSRWIARVFQDPMSGTATDLSILDNFRLAALRTHRKTLRLGITPSFKKEVAERVSTLGLGLEDKLQQPMGTLSGGQRQALTLLMSVMDKTRILLLDEPTAALDPKSAETVLKTANQLIKDYQLTTIFITHNLKDALGYGNRLIKMQGGKVEKDLDQAEKEKLSLGEVQSWFS